MANLDELRWDADGLIPAVVQDGATGEVLMVAYMNRASLEKTCELGETVFFSRSRQTLWHKGESSGHRQQVMGVLADCDQDALLFRVRPKGPACHTGARSCFFDGLQGFPHAPGQNLGAVLAELGQVITDRRVERPEGSYTAALFASGLKRILQKVGEEATETVVAGMSGDRREMIRETADLIFHLLVALDAMGIGTDEIAAELQSRRK